MKRRILIDTDIALGIKNRDVDDGLAIVMAMHSSALEIAGITLTYGNDSLDNVHWAMENLINQCPGFNYPLAKGSSSNQDLGKENKAVRQLIDSLTQKPATIVAIGPLTNIASAILVAPQIKSNIEEIVMVASRQRGQRFLTGNYQSSHPDLNFERDPQAVRILLESNIPLVFAPFEVSSKVWITEAVLDRIKQNHNPLTDYLHKNCHNWFKFWQTTFSTELYNVEGFNPFDCLAIAWLTDPDLLRWSYACLKIEEDNYDITSAIVQGTVNPKKLYLHAKLENKSAKSNLHKYIFDVDREAFLKSLINRLANPLI